MSSIIKKITNISNSSSVKINRKPFTFFICVLVSAFFWLLMGLSKDYRISVNFPVTYINKPKYKVVSNHLPDAIDIQIKSKGFNLLKYQFVKNKEAIVIDLKDAKLGSTKNNFYLYTNSNIDKIASQFSSSINVLRINPDTIHFTFNKKISKRVPVKVKRKITFSDEHALAGEIKIIPETIEISGAAEVVDKIKSLEAEPLVVDVINKSVKVKVRIKKTEAIKLLEFSQTEVLVSIPVTKFSEASVELPIQILNLPRNYNLKIFPDKIKIKYQVAFENYKKINASDFKAIVDYKKIEKGSNKIKIKLVNAPPSVKAIKLFPEKVEYILRK